MAPGKAGDHKDAFCSNLGSLKAHTVLSMLQGCCGGYLSNRFDLGYKVSFDSYRGRLRIIKVFWWLHGLAGCWVGLGHNCCRDRFRGRLRTTTVLW